MHDVSIERMLRLMSLTTPNSHYRVHYSPTVDWARADCLSDFGFPWESTPPPKTEFRALWDETHLHFRFDCEDHDLVLAEADHLKDRVLGSDRVEIFFTPDLTLRPYYALEMSPKAETLAYSACHYRQYDWDWQCPQLILKAAIQEPHYRVEGRLPLDFLHELNVLKEGGTMLHAGVYRAEFSRRPDGSIHAGWMPWINPQTERPDFHVPESFGIFELVG